MISDIRYNTMTKTPRPIVFRGKRKSDGAWVQGYFTWARNEDNFYCPYIADIPDWHEVYPETVGEYVFNDVKGNPVFEGDIVLFKDQIEHAAKVKWIPASARFMLVDSLGVAHGFNDGYVLKVIGNVHETSGMWWQSETIKLHHYKKTGEYAGGEDTRGEHTCQTKSDTDRFREIDERTSESQQDYMIRRTEKS